MDKKKALLRLSSLEDEAKQLRKIIESGDGATIDDVNSYLDACEILDKDANTKASATEQLEMIIEAVNFIDNGHKPWKADFRDKSLSKHLPYFEMTSGGWVLDCVVDYLCYTYCSVGLYYKNSATAKIIVERFMPTYKKMLG